MRRHTVDILVVCLLLLIGLWYNARANQARDALCALRANLETRVALSEQYLRDVASGERPQIQGITESDITTGITNQNLTIQALSSLDCP